jgi:hypothetical protein
MSALESLRRPYLFKDAGYRIEEEVRFVLGTNPVATNKSQGAMTNIEAKAIIGKTFKISPELPREEQTSIQKIATERLNAPLKMLPPTQEFKFLRPFSDEQDLSPGIFPDLD